MATLPDLEIYIQQYNVGTGKVEYYAEGLGVMWDNDFVITDAAAYRNPMAAYDWGLDTTVLRPVRLATTCLPRDLTDNGYSLRKRIAATTLPFRIGSRAVPKRLIIPRSE